MAIETEKKYRLTKEQTVELRVHLQDAGAEFEGDEFEENVLYAGGGLDVTTSVLRLRRTDKRAVLTFKKRGDNEDKIKRHTEEETEVADADALAAILAALNFTPTLIYEKRRETWQLKTTRGAVEIVIDELPFGHFAEIEGAHEAILAAEKILNLFDAEAESLTYPKLALRHGNEKDGVTEARFAAPQTQNRTASPPSK